MDSLADNTTADEFTTLREAITLANYNSDADDIDFAPSLTALGPATIALSSQLTISNDVTIVGLGSESLSIDAQGSSRAFLISGSGTDATIRDLTITGGNVTGTARGGAINNAGNLTLERVAMLDNHAVDRGGAIDSTGKLTIVESSFFDNSSLYGGAISVFTNNSNALRIDGSTFANNQARDGGAIRLHGTSAGGTATIVNSTFSANSAAQTGGAIRMTNVAPSLTIVNSTIFDNHADTNTSDGVAGEGGGIHVGGGNVKVTNSIVAGNSAFSAAGDDIHASLNSSSDYNLLGNDEWSQPGGHNIINDAAGLMPLGNYGGPTKTLALRYDSLALDAGDYDLALDADGVPLLNDQRGNVRLYGIEGIETVDDGVDMGAFEGGTVNVLIVNYVQQDKLDTVIDTDNLSLREALALAASTSGPDSIIFDESLFAGAPVTITLTYDGEDSDTAPDSLWLSNATISGPGMDDLIINADGQTRVMYALDNATLEGLTITGGNADNGGGILGGSGFQGMTTLRGTRITGNTALNQGGGISAYGNMTLIDCDISGNIAGSGGGGIWHSRYSDITSLTVVNSTISGNEVTGANGQGGGLYAATGGSYGNIQNTIANSVITGNSADNGGGVSVDGGPMEIMGSTIADNEAVTGAGGLQVLNSELRIVGTTISNNSGRVGGIKFNSYYHAFILQNATVSGNVGDEGGGIYIADASFVAISHGTIYDNEAAISSLAAGLIVIDSFADLCNTIVAGNKLRDDSPSDLFGAFLSSSTANLIGYDEDDYFDGFNGNLEGNPTSGPLDPLLQPLGDYGGPTKTHVPMADSPVIDATFDIQSVYLFDQRGAGFDRVVGERADIGAAEAHVVRDGGVIRVYGTQLDDEITVTENDVTIDRIGTIAIDIALADEIFIDGLQGDDSIAIDVAVLTDATVDGGDGDDSLEGGSGNDTLRGGNGDDLIHGGAGGDTLFGGIGGDTIYGEDGDDSLDGGDGDDILDGGDGDDEIIGGNGNDNITGGDGIDDITGNLGHDFVTGDASDISKPPQLDPIADVSTRFDQAIGIRLVADDDTTPYESLRWDVSINGGPFFNFTNGISIGAGALMIDPFYAPLPPGSYEFAVRVEDYDDETDTESFTLTVTDYNRSPPEAGLPIYPLKYEGESYNGVPFSYPLLGLFSGDDGQTPTEDLTYGGVLQSDGYLYVDWYDYISLSKREIITVTDDGAVGDGPRTRQQAIYIYQNDDTQVDSNEWVYTYPGVAVDDEYRASGDDSYGPVGIDLSFNDEFEVLDLDVPSPIYPIYDDLTSALEPYGTVSGFNAATGEFVFDPDDDFDGLIVVPYKFKHAGVQQYKYPDSYSVEYVTHEMKDSSEGFLYIHVGKAVKVNLTIEGLDEEEEEQGYGALIPLNDNDDNRNQVEDRREVIVYWFSGTLSFKKLSLASVSG